MKLVMETIRRHRVAIDALVKLIPQEALKTNFNIKMGVVVKFFAACKAPL